MSATLPLDELAPAQAAGLSPSPAVIERSLLMLPRSIWMPILAMSIIAIGAFLFNEWSVRRIRASDNELAALTAMQLDLIELRSRLSDADAGTRGFLLSNEPEDLQPFEEALKWMPIVGARLRVQTMNDAALLARVQSLESMRGQNVASLRAIVMLARQSRRTDAVALLRTGDGRLAMNALRKETQALFTELEKRVTALRRQTAIDVQWSRFAVAALGTLTLILLVLAVRLLLRDFRRQERARHVQATERRRLEEIVRDRTEELSRLTTYLQSVSEQEKAALARDLHDELGGLLTAAKMDLAWLQGRASASDPTVRAKLDALASAIDEAMHLKQRVVENLRPALLEHFGLPAALQSYFEETCKMANLACHTQVPDSMEGVPQDQAIALFRVGQESLTNIMRHAKARTVNMLCEQTAAGLHLRISDDGIGIAAVKLSGKLSHGLVGMRHRIETLHGVLKILPNRPSGTIIDVTVPAVSELAA
jgi:signal transduction histidine kinase